MITIDKNLQPASVRVTDSGALLTSPTMPVVTRGTVLSLATQGAAYTPFTATPCTALDLVNSSGTAIEYLRGGTGVALPVPPGTSRLVVGVTSADQISVRRVDQSATAATIHAEAFA